METEVKKINKNGNGKYETETDKFVYICFVSVVMLT